jgi:hypothetical protein
MDILMEFVKILLPAGIVLYAMFLTVRSMLEKEIERKKVDLKYKLQETVVPLRLQAYERLALLLERITPKNIILRINNPAFSAGEFHMILVHEIREEFNHNLSQQIYISDELWMLIKKAMEDTISTFNQAASELVPEAKSVDLSKAVFEKTLSMKMDPITHAMIQLKKEVAQFY